MTDTLALVKQLQARRAFFLNGGAWVQSVMPDSLCTIAADEILRLKTELNAANATIANLDRE